MDEELTIHIENLVSRRLVGFRGISSTPQDNASGVSAEEIPKQQAIDIHDKISTSSKGTHIVNKRQSKRRRNQRSSRN